MAVTEHQIRKAMKILANIIQNEPDGKTYWPIFERLERELSMLQRLESAVAYDDGEELPKTKRKRKTVHPHYAALYAQWDEENLRDKKKK